MEVNGKSLDIYIIYPLKNHNPYSNNSSIVIIIIISNWDFNNEIEMYGIKKNQKWHDYLFLITKPTEPACNYLFSI
jgi:hypothetical protein